MGQLHVLSQLLFVIWAMTMVAILHKNTFSALKTRFQLVNTIWICRTVFRFVTLDRIPLFVVQVLVSGSETTGEHRVQIWTPGYLQNGSPRPVITSAPAVITYGQNFTIQYSGVPSIDRVVLNRVTGSTDSNHMDQRQVVLTGGSSAGSIAANSPPNSNIAPPGQYMLFVLSNGVPSVAQYVSLQLSLPAPGTSSAG